MRALILTILLAAPAWAAAQTAEDSVLAPVKALFDAMRMGDSATIAACFTDSAKLDGISERGMARVSRTRFAHIISSLPKGSCDERPHYDLVRVDRSLAMVWAPYEFYFKGTFHHCGTDSFEIIRVGGVWRIHYAISTEWSTGCAGH